ncbi:MAG: hypothetical protein JNN15_14620 [Blastocatellia bacterium]|nr:hypothetical protein [Blastocatellia bacterium]
MKRSVFTSLILVFLLITFSNCRRASDNPLTEDVFKKTVEKNFKLAKSRVDGIDVAKLFEPPLDPSPILFPQSEPGNAAQAYWEVLKDKIDPRAESRQQFLDQTAPVVQVFDFAIRERLALSPSTIDAVKAEAEKVAKLSDLAKLEEGAKRKEFNLIGEMVPIPDNILNIQAVPLSVLKSYTACLIVKGLLSEAEGDKAKAESSMQTAIALGTHFTKDSIYAHYSAGLVVMEFGAIALRDFYKRNNDEPKAKAVDSFINELGEHLGRLGTLAIRDDNGQAINSLKTVGYLDEGVDTLAKIASDGKVPRAMRAGAVENMMLGYVFRYMMVEKSGRSLESSDYAPPSDLRIKALEQVAATQDKSISEMAKKAAQVLVKMKAMSSPERAKYWRDLNTAQQ